MKNLQNTPQTFHKENPKHWLQPVIGEILGIISWDPSVCKSNQLHVDILRFSCMKLGNIPSIPLKWPVIFLQSWTSTGDFSNSTGSTVTNCWFSLIIDCSMYDNRLDQCPGSFWACRVGQDPNDSKSDRLHAMIGENRQLVTDEPVEFEE